MTPSITIFFSSVDCVLLIIYIFVFVSTIYNVDSYGYPSDTNPRLSSYVNLRMSFNSAQVIQALFRQAATKNDKKNSTPKHC